MKQGIVLKKEYFIDHEAGSGSLYIPILEDLFPSLFGSKMEPYDRYVIIVEVTLDELYKYGTSKEVYDQLSIGDKVEITIDKFGMPEIIPLKNRLKN